jgi:hypothetical protein
MDIIELSKKYEHYETPRWAVDAILEKEMLSHFVVDPCAGTGVLSEAAKNRGHNVIPIDIYDWGYDNTRVDDFLSMSGLGSDNFSVLMNPPFSKACEFVEKSFEIGAKKVVCFQRFAWWESRARRAFWNYFPPSKVYICGDRAHCWLHGLKENEKGQKLHPETNKAMAGTTTAHAWFVFERDATGGTLLGHIWRNDVTSK